MRSNYDSTVGSVGDSATRIPIGPGIRCIDLSTEETIQVLTGWCLSEEVDNVSILQFM
jgi:hypothetical protein